MIRPKIYRNADSRIYCWLFLVCIIGPMVLWGEQLADTSRIEAEEDTVAAAKQDSLRASLIGPLFHNPPWAILNDRRFMVDFFVDFDPDSIATVSLLYRVDSTRVYREVPLRVEFGRYRYRLPKEELAGDALSYYFIVTLKDYRLWVYPTDEGGRPAPYTIDLVPPTREFFQRRRYE